MLERWDRLSPKELHLTSHWKAFLCSSHGLDQGLSPTWEPSSALSPCPLLPSPPGPSAAPGSLFCSQLLHHIQGGMPEAENLVPGAAPCPPPVVWGQWLNTARCPPGLCGKHPAVLPCLPAQSTGTLAGASSLLLPSSPTPSAPQ